MEKLVREAVMNGIGPLQERVDTIEQRLADLERRVEELDRDNGKPNQGG